MAKKPKVPHRDQLSLFDAGLEQPLKPILRGRSVTLAVKPDRSKAADIDVISDHRIKLHPRTTGEPTPFEKASYELYLRLKSETFALAKTTSFLAIVLIAVVFLGVEIPEAGLGLFKVGALKHHILVGLIGWLTFLSAGYTLVRAAFMMRKKIHSGLFYQRVLEFSNNPFIRIAHRFLDILFVALFAGIIALTWIVAGNEMMDLVAFIFREIMLLRDPWRPEVTPAL